MLIASLSLSACQSSEVMESAELAPPDDAPIFSESVFGVPASPRVSNLRKVRKGGGREQVGKPYKVRGKWYYPKDQPGYAKQGKASWYGANFHGRLTANGEVYDMFGLSAAHTTFPLPSYAMVTNLENGNRIMVRVNDRGPYAHGREIDVSSKAAQMLGFHRDGVADVKVEYVGRAPLEGDDTSRLMASFQPGEGRVPVGTPDQVMVASITAAARSPAGQNVATAYSEVPGVRPVGVPVPTRAERPGEGRVPVPSNLALAASLMSSYAASGNESGAAAALREVGAAAATQHGVEIISVGTLIDRSLVEKVRAVAFGRGSLGEEATDEGRALTLSLHAGVDADAVLRMLWQAGAEDAFVLRD
ncbi:septal ring lytic transglycosylase RlpA family protein [Antarcticirhabdus aurantiaca]|uniref:Septal ring lytic transglycosylase RlpA family protein n=1 Tax=Antarcticirhabdus aurantiaca TaxID=2606717 RepID=A0ACD4NVY4_9HYPH|nr:septal ring lytic transglycosylase RlpA family protein [Antarcticirhabdus aurantiaca]WAJ30923.1 septal ring lytic transglycosylase RlpA family protein [Jeongeuplla avenae]